MEDREKILAEAKSELRFQVPGVWDGERDNAAGESFRYFAEAVLGTSVARLIPSMESLRAAATRGEGMVRLMEHGRDSWLQVRSPGGDWFGFKWSARPPRKAGDVVTDVEIARLDPRHLHYSCPERIGFATLMNLRGRAAARASCQLGRFGAYVDAVSALVEVTGFKPGLEVSEGDLLMQYSQWEDLLRLDGGIAGEACREAADDIAQLATDRIMRWADGVLPGVIDGLRFEDCVWGKRMLRFNDLDNNVVLVEEGSRQAVFHRNSSHISDFRTYVLVRDGSDFSLHALEDGTDAFDRAMNEFRDGGEVPFLVASLKGGEVTRAVPFDETDILDAMAHGLKFTAEIVVSGDRADADYNEDFSYMDTHVEEDLEDDDAGAPAP